MPPSTARKTTATPATAPRVRRTRKPRGPLVNTDYLRTLVGYNARRASLSVISVFMERMDQFKLKVVDFSVLSLVADNPGITSRQLCSTLNVLPPNMVGLIAKLERRGLIDRQPHPTDGRATGLYLSDAGVILTDDAQEHATQLELDATSNLTATERKTLIRLLQKVYDNGAK